MHIYIYIISLSVSLSVYVYVYVCVYISFEDYGFPGSKGLGFRSVGLSGDWRLSSPSEGLGFRA